MSQELNWSKPVIRESVMTQFPIESVPHYLGDLCSAIALEVQVPIELPYFAALSVLAAASNGKVEVIVRGRHKEHLSFYNVIGLGSGNRKSEVVRTLRLPLVEIESELIAQVKPVRARQLAERKAYEQALEGLQAKARSKGVTPSTLADIEAATEKLAKCQVQTLPKIFADNVTPEKHAALIAEHGSSSIIEPEGGFFEGLSRYGNNKSAQVDYLNKSYGGEAFRVDRQGGDSIHAEQPHCVLHFSIQPHLILAIRNNPDFMGTGFANRFLFCLPQSLIGQRALDVPPVAQGLLDSWAMTIKALFDCNHAKPIRQLTIGQSGLALLRSFNEQLEPQLVTSLLPVQGWASKLAGQLVRIAALYELAANPSATEISSENIAAALALAPYLQEHALKALTGASQDQPLHKVLTYLMEKQEGLEPQQSSSVGSVGAIPSFQFTTRQLQQHFNKSSWLAISDNQAATLRGILTELAKDNWVRLVPTESTPQGGRPAELWEVNPYSQKC
jgi:replicative DNA helicase